MTHPMKAYQRVRITTASPGELIVLLLEGLVRFTLKASDELDGGNFVAAAGAIERTLDIITTLRESLDHGAAPVMAARFDQTYVTWSHCLVRAQAARDVAGMRSIAEQMNDVADGWRQAVASGAGRDAQQAAR